jgi:hypothetical protein
VLAPQLKNERLSLHLPKRDIAQGCPTCLVERVQVAVRNTSPNQAIYVDLARIPHRKHQVQALERTHEQSDEQALMTHGQIHLQTLHLAESCL